MVYLPPYIFIHIYSYVGSNAFYLHKDYLPYLQELRRQFIEKPLKLEYRLARWKTRVFDIESNYDRRSRASIYVEPVREIDISGNLALGSIIDDERDLELTTNVENRLIPVSTMHHSTFPVYCMNVLYWTLYSLRCKEVHRYELYKKLWVSDHQLVLSGPDGP